MKGTGDTSVDKPPARPKVNRLSRLDESWQPERKTSNVSTRNRKDEEDYKDRKLVVNKEKDYVRLMP